MRVQYQGDNIVGIVHMPGKSSAKAAERALDIAAGMQASMQHTLSEVVPEAKKLTVTIGVALADTLATRLGPYGRRDAMVVGPAVTKADRISMALDGTEVGFSKPAYDALPEHLQKSFEWSETREGLGGRRLARGQARSHQRGARARGGERPGARSRA